MYVRPSYNISWKWSCYDYIMELFICLYHVLLYQLLFIYGIIAQIWTSFFVISVSFASPLEMFWD
jgi:hypothetical protein